MPDPKSFDNLRRNQEAIDCLRSDSPCGPCEASLRRHLASMAATMPISLLLDVSVVIHDHRESELQRELESN